MQAFSSSFEDYDASIAFHVRVWQLELVDTEDRIVKISGLMFGKSTFRSLSEFMREKLGRNDLLLFDGNYDPIDRIEAKYDRNTKIMMEDREDDYVIWDYHEKLVVDRESETIEYFRQIAEGCDVCHKYHVSGGVSQLLDNLNADIFSKKKAIRLTFMSIRLNQGTTRSASGQEAENGEKSPERLTKRTFRSIGASL